MATGGNLDVATGEEHAMVRVTRNNSEQNSFDHSQPEAVSALRYTERWVQKLAQSADCVTRGADAPFARKRS